MGAMAYTAIDRRRNPKAALDDTFNGGTAGSVTASYAALSRRTRRSSAQVRDDDHTKTF
jgi:hypothetical protein